MSRDQKCVSKKYRGYLLNFMKNPTVFHLVNPEKKHLFTSENIVFCGNGDEHNTRSYTKIQWIFWIFYFFFITIDILVFHVQNSCP